MTTSRNRELAKLLARIADMYEFLGGDTNRFRALAYRKAAQVIENLPEDIATYMEKHDLQKVHGIGAKTIEKIREFLKTGTIQKYEELRQQVPESLIPLMDVPGLGPKTLRQLYETFHIQTEEDLRRILQSGEVYRLKGFGPKKVQKILHGLELRTALTQRMLYWEALTLARDLLHALHEQLGTQIQKSAYAGSLRRGKETIGDIDLLISTNPEHRTAIIQTFTQLPDVKEILAAGETKASVLVGDNRRQVDLRLIQPDQWGAALMYFTGSKNHNVRLRELARARGWKLNEYGLFDETSNTRLAGTTEEEVFACFNMQWIPPEMREDQGEIELALNHQIPQLVTIQDIRGDMQSHSTWSDGSLSILEMADYVLKHFPHYEYLVLTDHSQAVRVAGGLSPEQFRKQKEEIQKVNAELGRDFVKAGAEVDILPNGNLDLPDDLLQELDFVIASIHSHFQRDNTDRIIQACLNPYVHAIGHPTGRLIGSREPYPLNMEQIIEVCAQTGTALEINGQPDRMDLNDQYARWAREAGVPLILSTDAHYSSNFHYMEIAVVIARRAWCSPQHILNTRPWHEITLWKQEKARKTRAYKSKRHF